MGLISDGKSGLEIQFDDSICRGYNFENRRNELIVVIPPTHKKNLYLMVLTPNLTVFGGRDFEK